MNNTPIKSIIKPTKFEGVYETQKGKNIILLTKSQSKGDSVYGETIFSDGKDEYREWVANRSKLAAFMLKGADQINIKPGSVVLYLGASTGTTVSHVSDIVGQDGKPGFIFAIEYAPRVARELVFLSSKRNNIAPILGDAARPETYMSKCSEVDIIYQDVAQRNQVEIFLRNINMFLKKGGFGLLAIKARSIDVTERPDRIFEVVKKQLLDPANQLLLIDHRRIDPFQKDHAMFLVKRK